jgi:hypothetical protein
MCRLLFVEPGDEAALVHCLGRRSSVMIVPLPGEAAQIVTQQMARSGQSTT